MSDEYACVNNAILFDRLTDLEAENIRLREACNEAGKSTAELLFRLRNAHDARITQLLAANNVEVERRRDAERELEGAKLTIAALLNQNLDMCSALTDPGVSNWYAVFPGSEKLDIGSKRAAAYCQFRSHAELLVSTFWPGYGYIEPEKPCTHAGTLGADDCVHCSPKRRRG